MMVVEKQIEKIRDSYIPKSKEKTKLEELKDLDRKAKTPAIVFGYIFGIVGSLILGTGMCFAMKVIGASLSVFMPIGIGIGLVGILMVSITYPIYKKILNKSKVKYSEEIIKKSNELLNEGK